MHHQRHEDGHQPGERGERRFRAEGGGPRGGRRGFRGRSDWHSADVAPADDAAEWFAGRLPDDWFAGAVTVTVDRDEIVVIGQLPTPDSEPTAATAQGRISRFREDTRDARIKIADEAEGRYGRKVSWGAGIGDTQVLFTHLAVPAMTRLRIDERQVLDTLVDAGVARSRSDALAWCVRLVGEHTDDWLAGLREALAEVGKRRAEGPNLDKSNNSGTAADAD